jgi:hypothetical protein
LKLRVRDLEIRIRKSWAMFGVGILALVIGRLGLTRPDLVLSMLNFTLLDRTTALLANLAPARFAATGVWQVAGAIATSLVPGIENRK